MCRRLRRRNGGCDEKRRSKDRCCLYDLDHTLARPLLEQCEYPWEALPGIRDLILELGNRLPESEYEKRGETVSVPDKTARVFESAYLGENIIIGKDVEVRHCAFLRSNALVGEGAVVGNSTELKNVILFDKVQGPPLQLCGRLHPGL